MEGDEESNRNPCPRPGTTLNLVAENGSVGCPFERMAPSDTGQPVSPEDDENFVVHVLKWIGVPFHFTSFRETS
jgi:hypothetical protein